MSKLDKTAPSARTVDYHADAVDINYRAGMMDAAAWFTRMREGDASAADVQDVITVDLPDCSKQFRKGWRAMWTAFDAALLAEVDGKNGTSE